MNRIKLFQQGINEPLDIIQGEVNDFLLVKKNDIEVVDIKINDVMNESEWYITIMVHYKEIKKINF